MSAVGTAALYAAIGFSVASVAWCVYWLGVGSAERRMRGRIYQLRRDRYEAVRIATLLDPRQVPADGAPLTVRERAILVELERGA